MELLSPRRRPRLLGALVQLHDNDDPRRSDATLLAAALLTLGIPPVEQEYFHSTYHADGRGSTVWKSFWNFREDSTCKRFNSRKLIRWWSDGQWLLNNPTHPLAILRGGLTYKFTFNLTPRFTVDELRQIETPDTWLEAGARNLILLLRDIPSYIQQAARRVVWFGPEHAGCVPRCMPQESQKRFLKYVENPSKRHAA